MSFTEAFRGFLNASIAMIVNFLVFILRLIIDALKIFVKCLKPVFIGLSRAFKLVWKVVGPPVGWLFKIILFPVVIVFKLIFSFSFFKKAFFKLLMVAGWLLIKPLVSCYNIIKAYLVLPVVHYFVRILSVQTINELTLLTLHRPAIRSLCGTEGEPSADFTSWEMLTNRMFNARTLNPAQQSGVSTETLVKLFMREQGEEEKKDDRTSVLFPFFARWLTDSFMRINPTDRRKNSSNHELDLCQIYGLKAAETDKLRLMEGGRLRSRYMGHDADNENLSLVWDDDNAEVENKSDCRRRELNSSNGLYQPVCEEYLPLIFEKSDEKDSCYFYEGFRVKHHYQSLMDRYMALSGNESLPKHMEKLFQFVGADRKKDVESIVGSMYATGLERGNASVGYTMFSTLFLREHNRICDLLVSGGLCPVKDDEKIFQTARMINTIIYLKIIIQSYINHIGGKRFTWGFYPDKLSIPDHSNFGRIKQQWFKPNWVSLEFNLLYRWHSFIPDVFQLGKKSKPLNYFFHNNGHLELVGLDECFKAASQQYANKLSLKNSPSYLEQAERDSLNMNRKFGVAPFMSYHKYFKAGRTIKKLEDLCGSAVAKEIREAYGINDDKEVLKNLDFYVGLFAEKKFESKPFGELIYRMVASDAFTHLYRNPLLSPEIFNEKILGKTGMSEINNTQSLEDVLLRNSRKNKVVANFGIA